MYTQCPECGVAFNVTAEVLKQAAGQVRCGRCSVAFNALDFLSEEKPDAPVQPEAEPQSRPAEHPPDEPVELESVTPPKAISAEQSAALLKTLDQLAGSDIRIEDTGVEWRVLNDDEEAEALDDASAEDALPDEESVEALLERSFTPKDEVITKSANSAEAPAAVEEMRFDDNTPLPDDFDFESTAS
ncbi:MAG: zinc-ribbon domain-containing protein, partial [Gammaproteobacteria bacterium]|nr:zinc-ribbon domain-containing protein [Gammaproteobacteria bacterium]